MRIGVRFSFFLWGALLAAQAQGVDLGEMQNLYRSVQPRWVQSPFQRELVLDSTEAPERLSGDIYATLDAPLASLELVNRSPQRWCEILLLLSNTKSCRVGSQNSAPTLELRIGTKGPQALASTTPMDFQFASSEPRASVLETRLNAATGPMGTTDGTLWVKAIALGPKKSFIHLHYSYSSSLAGRFATGVYLQTLGRGKVGFSPEPSATAEAASVNRPAETQAVGGVRGIVERNTMRYFLGLSCALQFATSTASARFAQMAPCWYDETERYPVQLHEMSRTDYLDMKREEYARDVQTRP
jgi:hypothetical protein